MQSGNPQNLPQVVPSVKDAPGDATESAGECMQSQRTQREKSLRRWQGLGFRV